MGTLRDYLKKLTQDLELEFILQLLVGIARGILHLHFESVIVKNLSSQIIYLTKNSVPKLTDFWISKISKDEEKAETDQIYLAPECIKK